MFNIYMYMYQQLGRQKSHPDMRGKYRTKGKKKGFKHDSYRTKGKKRLKHDSYNKVYKYVLKEESDEQK